MMEKVEKLTQEEKTVLIMLAQGYTSKQIVALKDLSARRICEIKKSFVAKLGARNHTHAVYLALSQELI